MRFLPFIRASAQILFLAMAIAIAAGIAWAQRVLVETNSLTAIGQAVRVYMHSVDAASGSVLPLPVALPGETPLGPVLHTSEYDTILLTTADPGGALGGYDDNRLTYTSQLQANPFRLVANHAIARDTTWRQRAAAMAHDGPEQILIMMESRATDDGAWEGRLSLYPMQGGAPSGGSLQEPAIPMLHRSLPGPAERVVVLDGLHRVAVLGRGTFGAGSWLVVLNVATGEVLLDATAEPDGERWVDSEPGDIAVSPDGAHVFVMTSGYAADSPTGDPVSWMRVYDSVSLREIGVPLEVPGLVRVEEPALEPDAAGGVWVASHWPVAGFAYVSHATLHKGTWVRDVAHSFTTTQQVHVAASPTGGDVFVAVGERLERWDARGAMLAQAAYDSSIRVLRWIDETVLLGEAGRLHRVDPISGASISAIPFQSGQVTDLIVLPPFTIPEDDTDGDGLGPVTERQLGTDPLDPDTDYDGIPDGIDEEPLRSSPLLQVPGALVFRGESVGRDVKSLIVNAYLGIATGFQVQVPEPFVPWLRAAPESGRTPARILTGVDPLHFVPSPTAIGSGWMTVSVRGVDAGRPATLSPQRIEIHVLPKATGVRRILWLWADSASGPLRSAADPRRLKALADKLGGAPEYFSHQEHVGPFAGTLSAYSVVVLGGEAAMRGVVNPHALLEYVGRGGALLFLGASMPDATPESLRWMRPLGLGVDPGRRVDGIFTASVAEGLTEHWGSVSIQGGCALSVARPYNAIVEGPADAGYAVFSAKGYGRGRVAALASVTPLESRAMADPEARQFAASLFAWLAQAGFDVADRDGDGLPDWQEDANANRTADWGETNADRADTDGDGIADGYEDANWNGVVDEGETSPLKPDSDGDGIYDGADDTPVPSPGAPLIALVAPATGPAEGGNDVMIGGTHLPADIAVWFGARQAPHVVPLNTNELQVQAPPAAASGPVDLRLTDAAGHTVVIAPRAYTYTPATQLHVVLQTLDLFETQDGMYRGRTAINLEGPAIDLRRVRVYLRAEPSNAVTWGTIEQGRVAYDYGRRVTMSRLSPDQIAVDLHEFPGRHLPMTGQLAIVNWAARTPEDGTPLTLAVERAISRIRNGESVPTIPDAPLQPLKRGLRPRRAQE